MRFLVWSLLFVSSLGLASEVTVSPNPSTSVISNGKSYRTGFIPATPAMKAARKYFKPAMKNFVDLPEAFDARDEGFVTGIRDQGNCGSCWSFSRTAALEAAFLVAGKSTASELNLAEQDALVNDRSAYGCSGGFMDGSYEFNNGVSPESLCPYKANDRVACRQAKFGKPTKWAFVGEENKQPSDEMMKAAIYQYKVISVEVDGNFSPDASGRITRCGNRSINHMVDLVGWRPAPSGGGTEFLIRNSWGTSWGVSGYAWSKLGCNLLAAEAMFFYVEGEGPQPASLELPISITVHKGQNVALHVKAEAGMAYTWSTGAQGDVIWVKADADSSYSLKATDAQGNVTEQSVKIVTQ